MTGVRNKHAFAIKESELEAKIVEDSVENFGIVVAEALASGTPVLTTNGTPWNVLNSEHCGWCVDVNVEAIKSALRSFAASSEDELQQMGLRGRRLVEENYDTRSIAREYVKLYTSLCR